MKKGNSEDILYQDIPRIKDETEIDNGVYYGIIESVKTAGNGNIIVVFNLAIDDGKQKLVYLKTRLTPIHTWEMINRLANTCRTTKPIEFVGTEIYASVIVSELSSSKRYVNVVDILPYDDFDEYEYEVTKKGYFIK